MSENKCVSVFFAPSETDVCSMDCSHNEELVDKCQHAEFVEVFDPYFDKFLYELVEDFEKTDGVRVQIGRGLKHTADDSLQGATTKRRRLSGPSTSEPSSVNIKDNEMTECTICNISVKKRYLTNHLRSNVHKNNAFHLHIDFPNVKLIETAFGKRVYTFKITPPANCDSLMTFEIFFELVRNTLIHLINESVANLTTFKVNFILHAHFVQETKNLTNVFDFQTTNFILSGSDDFDIFLDSLQKTISNRITEFEAKDSGWSIKNVISLDMNINKFKPLRGSSFIVLPRDISAKKAIINVKNSDVYCLKWALLSALYPVTVHTDRVSSYAKFQHKLNFNGIAFPVKLKDVHKVESLNNISINVFGLEYNATTKAHTVIGPLYFTKSYKPNHVNLLYISNDNNGHYCYIKNLSRLVSKQITSHNSAIYICDGCLIHFSSEERLSNHKMNDCTHVRTDLPNTNINRKNWWGENVPNDKLNFENFDRKLRVPFVVYADFESFLKPIKSCSNDPEKSSTDNVQVHSVYSFGYYIKCSYDDRLSKYVTYTGENCALVFMNKLYEDIRIICSKTSYQKCPIPLTERDKINVEKSSICYICERTIVSEKYVDHDWLTGFFVGVSHEQCSNKYRKNSFIPVILHNLSNYDAHFIVHALNFVDGEVQIIPQNKEKYISFSKVLKVNGKNISVRFIDSFKFLSSSLDSLVKNLDNSQFHELRKQYPCENDFNLLKRKGVYPYEYMTSFDSLKLTSLPTIDNFYSTLTGDSISENDYSYAQKVWSHFQCKTMSDYSDLYLKVDVMLLSDIFENFRNVCIKTYDLDPAHYYTAPGLSWDGMLKYTKINIELLTDFDKVAFIKSGIRGGISQCSNRYAKANNPYMSEYSREEPNSYLTYLDANNLYGWAMSQYLPLSNFEWSELNTNYDVPIDSDIGYILEVDLEYPDSLHDSHSDFPLCPENICIGGTKDFRLILNLNEKKNYIIHYRNLLQCKQLGMQVTKVHRVLKFKQAPWLKTYIELNTQLRTVATSDFEKDFYKLMNNSIFGKTMENIEKRVNVKLLMHWENHGKIQGAQSLIARPEFHSLAIFSENLVAVQLRKTKLYFNKPIYLGFSILDISKTLMYDFHYNYMKRKFSDLKLLYTDTDSLVYQIYCEDFYKQIKPDLTGYFDTSDYPHNNAFEFPQINKKKLGFFKDENNGKIFTEFVGLRSKMYAMRVEDRTITKAKGVNKSVQKNLNMDKYKSCLFNKDVQLAEMYRFKSVKHIIFTQKINKICLSYNDSKRYIIPNSTDTLAWGHYKLRDN